MDGEHTTNLRDKILVEASRLFAMRGVESVSMREIAAEVGLSKPGLYYYFEDKETLVLAILVDNLDRVAELVDRANKVAPDSRSRLAYLIRGFFAFSPERLEMIRLANRRFPTLSLPARKAFDRIYQQKFIRKIEEIMLEGIERGELRLADAHRVTWIFLGMLYPFFSSEAGERGDPTEEILSVFMNGMKTEA